MFYLTAIIIQCSCFHRMYSWRSCSTNPETMMVFALVWRSCNLLPGRVVSLLVECFFPWLLSRQYLLTPLFHLFVSQQHVSSFSIVSLPDEVSFCCVEILDRQRRETRSFWFFLFFSSVFPLSFLLVSPVGNPSSKKKHGDKNWTDSPFFFFLVEVSCLPLVFVLFLGILNPLFARSWYKFVHVVCVRWGQHSDPWFCSSFVFFFKRAAFPHRWVQINQHHQHHFHFPSFLVPVY